MPHEILPITPQPFGNSHRVGMEVALLTKPRILDEVPDVDDEGLPFPSPDCVSVVRRICVYAMSSAVGRNNAVGITRHVFVEEYHLVRHLYDATRWPHSRQSRPRAVKHRVSLA